MTAESSFSFSFGSSGEEEHNKHKSSACLQLHVGVQFAQFADFIVAKIDDVQQTLDFLLKCSILQSTEYCNSCSRQ